MNESEKYQKLLEFVKKTASLHEPQEKILMLADAGYQVDNVLNARALLSEIGEIAKPKLSDEFINEFLERKLTECGEQIMKNCYSDIPIMTLPKEIGEIE